MEDHAFVALGWQARISVDRGEHVRGGLSAGGRHSTLRSGRTSFAGRITLSEQGHPRVSFRRGNNDGPRHRLYR
jgi:hypothetical protein